MIGSDAKGSKFNESWGKAIYDALKEVEGFENVAPLPLAVVSGVPFFLKMDHQNGGALPNPRPGPILIVGM